MRYLVRCASLNQLQTTQPTTSKPNHLQRKHPPPPKKSCRPLLVATYNPEEGPLRDHLLDRIAVVLEADAPGGFSMVFRFGGGVCGVGGRSELSGVGEEERERGTSQGTHDSNTSHAHKKNTKTQRAATWQERVEAIDAAVRFQDHADEVLAETAEETSGLAAAVVAARAFLRDVVITPEQVGLRSGCCAATNAQQTQLTVFMMLGAAETHAQPSRNAQLLA